jgi:histidyl-tRNA synthetase
MCALQRAAVSVETDYEGKSLKSQMRRSDKFNARFTLIIGEDELKKGRAILKEMDAGSQEEVALDAGEIAGKVKV